jgi:ATP-dependent helicase HrpB
VDSNVDRSAARRILDLAERFEKQLDLFKQLSQPSPLDRTVRSTENTAEDLPREPVGILLAFAYPDRIAQRRTKEYDKYVLSGGRGARLSAADPLTREEYLVVAELDGDTQEAQIFFAAPVDREDLEAHCAELINIEDFCGWDDEAQAVVSRSRHLLGRLIVREHQQTNPSDDLRLPALLEGIRKTGLGHLPWDKKSLALRSRIAFIGRVTPKPHSWPEVSDAALLSNLECWLAPFLGGITRLKELQKIDLVDALFSLLSPNQQRQLDRLAPTHLQVPSGSRVPLDYGSGDTPVLSVRLQEMFGCSTTPAIAGQTPVIVHLLSPAGRPIQVTSDLANFWATTYREVKKELCGRYPRHYWPDNPLAATPTKRAKPRKR